MEKSDKQKLIIMFAVSYLAYSVIYIARLNFSVVASVMESAGTLTNSQIGVISGAFSLVYAIAKVPNGYIGDKVNSKLVIIAGLCIAGISNIIIGIAPTYVVMVLFWSLNAYGQSMLWGPLLRSFTENYPAKVCGRLLPFLASSIGVGSIVGLGISITISSKADAATCFIIPGVICLVSALLVAGFLKGAPGKVGEKQNIFSVVVKFIKDSKFREMITPALGHGMVKDNVSVWMVVFFVTAYCVNVEDITAYVFFIPVCTLAGRLLYPLLFRFIGNAYKLSAIAFAVTAAAAVVLFTGSVPMWCAAACLGTIAAFASVLNTHFVTVFPQEYTGENLCFAASTIDLIIYGGAALGSAIYGYTIEWFGFSSMFAIWAVCSAISIPLMLRNGRNKN